MSITAVMWMTKQEAGDATAKSLLFWLAWHLNDETGLCYPSLATLQKEMEVGSVNTVRSAIEKLIKAGVITSVTERSKGGKVIKTCYRLNGYQASNSEGSDSELSKTDVSNSDRSKNDGSNSEQSLYQNLTHVVSKIDSNKKEKEKDERKVGVQTEVCTQLSTPPAASSEPPKKKKAPVTKVPCPDEVDPELWDGWMAIRKAKRQPISAYALKRTRQEADKCGLSLEQAIRFAFDHGWAGFIEDYFLNAIAKGATIPEKRITEEQRKDYRKQVAKAYGFPDTYLDAAAEGRYTAEGSGDLLAAVMTTTKQGAA